MTNLIEFEIPGTSYPILDAPWLAGIFPGSRDWHVSL
jgi:hypothetical protein